MVIWLRELTFHPLGSLTAVGFSPAQHVRKADIMGSRVVYPMPCTQPTYENGFIPKVKLMLKGPQTKGKK